MRKVGAPMRIVADPRVAVDIDYTPVGAILCATAGQKRKLRARVAVLDADERIRARGTTVAVYGPFAIIVTLALAAALVITNGLTGRTIEILAAGNTDGATARRAAAVWSRVEMHTRGILGVMKKARSAAMAAVIAARCRRISTVLVLRAGIRIPALAEVVGLMAKVSHIARADDPRAVLVEVTILQIADRAPVSNGPKKKKDESRTQKMQPQPQELPPTYACTAEPDARHRALLV